MTRIAALVGTLLTAWTLTCAAAAPPAERTAVEHWRAARVAELTGENGWLTLVGLYWLESGENTFGRSAANRLVLDHPALADTAGTFILDGPHVRFRAAAGATVLHDGQPVSSIDLVADTEGEPTILSSGSLRFHLIERAGKRGIRVRDVDSPRRRQFAGLTYFPIDAGWVVPAHFERYEPHRQIRIINILGMEQDMDSPGALVFRRDGRDWRLDTVLESPGDDSLFVMFADGTSGRESYGGGRFLHVPLPAGEEAWIDFNQSYNPPCAFNDFATCPLPPYQNRLALRIEAGEKRYGTEHSAAAH